jgi:hypothetical protein
MNLGCFWVVVLDDLMFSPVVPKTVMHGFYCLACGKGCFSPNARLVPADLSGQPEATREVKKPVRAAWARTGF